LAVDQAVEEEEGGSVGSMNDPWPTRNPLRRPEAGESWRRISLRLEFWPRARQNQLIGGKTPRGIELALRTRMIDASIPLPYLSKTYDPRTSPTGTA
jgi:hypothetical protein